MVKLQAYTLAMPLDEGMIQVRILSGVPVMCRYQSDLMAPPAKRLIRRFESYSALQDKLMQIMEG